MSGRIVLGHAVDAGGQQVDGQVCLDLGLLVRKSHLLLQANSGGGKSRAIRRIAEQCASKIQTLIIDPEGEFSTLREKFDFLHVGRGGDTPADPRFAGLLANRLREFGTSAVFDLFDMPPPVRHRWVRLFFEALIETPKKLWHKDVLVILDEAQLFAPEKGEKPSEASAAVSDAASRCRKRGVSFVFATPRLAVLDKDVAAPCGNVLVGQTYLDQDRDRAGKALAIPRGDLQPFFAEIGKFSPGTFFGQGRAISLDRVRLLVGPVATSHGEDDKRRRRSTKPIPPPDKIRHLLPKLGDLPKEADEKVATEAGLRAEVHRLTADLRTMSAELRAAKAATPPAPAVKVAAPKRVPVLRTSDIARLERAVERLDSIRDKTAQAQQAVVSTLGNFKTEFEQARRSLTTSAAAPATAAAPPLPPLRLLRPPGPPKPHPVPAAASEPNDGQTRRLTEGERRVLTVLAQFSGNLVTRRKAGILAGYSPSGSSMRAILAGLRKSAYVEDRSGDVLVGTESGLTALGQYAPLPTGPALLDHWINTLPECPAVFLRVLSDAYPKALTKEELAAASTAPPYSKNYVAGGSSMRAGLARLRALDLIVDVGETMKGSPELME